MLDQSEAVLAARAARLREGIGEGAEIVRTQSRVGGGALPVTELEGPAVALAAGGEPAGLAAALRHGDPPVIARVHDGRVLLDPRTLTDAEVDLVLAAVRRALAGA